MLTCRQGYGRITFLPLDLVFGRKQTCPFFSKILKYLIENQGSDRSQLYEIETFFSKSEVIHYFDYIFSSIRPR